MTRRSVRRTVGVVLAAATCPFLSLVSACETPPSQYIPPPERPEVPNLDPPPGVPIMPVGSAASKKADGGAAAPISTIEPPSCKADKDCVVTVRIACCAAGDPRAALKSEVDVQDRDCKDAGPCGEVEMKGDAQSAKDYVARCQNKSCTLVKKKKKGK